MTFNPPYSLRGEAGKSLDAGWHTLEALGIHAASVTLRSLAEDELAFTQRAAPGRLIADDDQWISLADGSGQIILTGIAKRTFQFPQNLYQFSVTNVYRGLTQTPLIDAATRRPYTLYTEADLGATVVSLLGRAQALGLPIQPPATLPEMFAVPKMAFVSASCGSALEDALKWLPDAASRMDYATTPPTLRFSRRASSTAIALNLDVAGHGVTAMTLTAMPEARALFVAFVYAQRRDALLVDYATQQAGDPAADSHRSLSIYLSGADKVDLMSSEALVTSNNALLTAKASLTAANASVTAVNAQIAADYAAAVAAIPGTPDVFNALAYVIARDSAMTVAGVTPSWQSDGFAVCYTWSYGFSGGFPDSSPTITSTGRSYSALAYSPVTTGVVLGTGWAVPSGTFTDAQLATAGSTKKLANLSGRCVFQGGGSGSLGFAFFCSGGLTYPTWYYGTQPPYVSFYYHDVAAIAVDWLSLAPSTIRANLAAAALAVKNGTTVDAAAATNTFIDQAAFVEAPDNLAANYFAAQDWLPYSGSLSFTPTAPVLPAPGDFVSIAADGLPGAFASMATPVSALQIDLQTGASTVTLGPSARMTFSNLQDRLRIPPADNCVPA